MGVFKFNKYILILFFIFTITFSISVAVDYKVGDSQGWRKSGVDYKSWSAAKTFHSGNVIWFEYNKEFHNVLRVSHNSFKTCNATSPFKTFDSGNDSFILKKSGGNYFFICGFTGHCQEGQKVHISVVGGGEPQPPSSSTPGGSPALSPASSPPGGSPTLAPSSSPPGGSPALVPASSTPSGSPALAPASSTPDGSPAPAPTSSAQGGLPYLDNMVFNIFVVILASIMNV